MLENGPYAIFISIKVNVSFQKFNFESLEDIQSSTTKVHKEGSDNILQCLQT
jgi:hypothetical protein